MGMGMIAGSFAIIAAFCVVAGGFLGLFLRHYLPEKFTTGGPRDMIGAVVGLLTLLAALVLGLLIWTAYSVYASQNARRVDPSRPRTFSSTLPLPTMDPRSQERAAPVARRTLPPSPSLSSLPASFLR